MEKIIYKDDKFIVRQISADECVVIDRNKDRAISRFKKEKRFSPFEAMLFVLSK